MDRALGHRILRNGAAGRPDLAIRPLWGRYKRGLELGNGGEQSVICVSRLLLPFTLCITYLHVRCQTKNRQAASRGGVCSLEITKSRLLFVSRAKKPCRGCEFTARTLTRDQPSDACTPLPSHSRTACIRTLPR